MITSESSPRGTTPDHTHFLSWTSFTKSTVEVVITFTWEGRTLTCYSSLVEEEGYVLSSSGRYLLYSMSQQTRPDPFHRDGTQPKSPSPVSRSRCQTSVKRRYSVSCFRYIWLPVLRTPSPRYPSIWRKDGRVELLDHERGDGEGTSGWVSGCTRGER